MGIKASLYSKTYQTLIRLFSFVALIILVVSTIRIIYTGGEFNDLNELFINNYGTIILNCCCIICFIVLLIFPKKLIALSIITFLYAFFILIDEPNNQMGILMSLLCYYTLYVRNFFHKNQLVKKILFFIILLAAFIAQIRFGLSIFLNSFFDSFAFLFVIFLIIFFFREKNIIEIANNTSEKILNLFSFPGTRKEDIQLLQLVLENKQYKEISQIVFRTEGTVRNRLNKLYDILGVGDRIGFVTTYAGYEIVYDETIEAGSFI